MRAWGPVFPKMEKAVPPYVYQNFYPQGWEARQTADIKAMRATQYMKDGKILRRTLIDETRVEGPKAATE